jgi:hypothetical protein
MEAVVNGLFLVAFAFIILAFIVCMLGPFIGRKK